MPLTKVKTRSSPANTATIIHQESTALLHELRMLGLDAGQLGKGNMPPQLHWRCAR